MIKQELSDKIRIAGFICTIMVLYRHSLNYLAFFNSWSGYGINKMIQGNVLTFTEIAVPFFFIISGFFFFKYSYSFNTYTTMIKKKYKSLLIPYIIWNIGGLLMLYAVDKSKIGNTFIYYTENLLYSKWNGPLWYIRDLIIMMILVPIYQWIYYVNKFWLYSIFSIILFLYWIPVDISLLSSEGLFFFFIGGILSKHDLLSQKCSYIITLLLFILWLGLSINIIAINSIYVHRINTLIGIFVFWQLLNYIPYKKILIKLSSYSFLIYVMHSYIVKILKKTIAHFFYGNEIAALITFLILPPITAYIIILIGKNWKKFSTKTYNIVTGNR